MTVTASYRDRYMGRKRSAEPRDRIDLRAEAPLVARLRRQADRLGLSMSAYIRLAVTQRLEADEFSDPESKKSKR